MLILNFFFIKQQTDASEVDSDTAPENELQTGKSVAEVIGQDGQDPSKLDKALGFLPPRWKNW